MNNMLHPSRSNIRIIKDKLKLRMFVEDNLSTLPNPLHVNSFNTKNKIERNRAVVSIKNTSAYVINEYVKQDVIKNIRDKMEDAFSGNRKDLKVIFNEKTGITRIINPLRLSKDILSLATDPFICSIIEQYFRRRIYLADVDMRRVPPLDMDEVDRMAGTNEIGYTSSHWHRDMRGRQIKVMIYLTDVTEHESNFSYLPGTHKEHQARPRKMLESRISDEWVIESGIQPVEVYGKAGATLIFDTNPVHRLRRKSGGNLRDSVTFYYTPGQELRTLDYSQKEVATLDEKCIRIFSGRRLKSEE